MRLKVTIGDNEIWISAEKTTAVVAVDQILYLG